MLLVAVTIKQHFASGEPTEDNPDPELNSGYKTPLKPKKKLPAMRSDAPTKRPKRCKDNTEIFNKRSTCSSTVTGNTLNAGPSEELDVADCNTWDKLCSENNQSSRRPPHIIQDHGYCFGWAEMEDPNYCTNEACLKKIK